MSYRNPRRKAAITERDFKKKRTGGGKEAGVLKIKNKAAPLVTVGNAHQKMHLFTKFYKDNYIIQEGEWKDFLQGVLTRPPIAFRIPRSHMICNNPALSKKSAVSQAEVLLDKFKSDVLPDTITHKIDDKQCEMKCLEWYPHEYAWQANFDVDQLKNSNLIKLSNFIIEETSGFNIMKQEVHTIIPPLLLDVKPHHKILDMFSSPGWMAAQLSEDLYSNPKTSPTGFLITNDSDQSKLQWRWIQGPNMMFLHHDAKYLPWLYTSREHTPENRILFDKILCDVPCSDDGQLGKNAFNRTLWSMKSAYANHKNQKKFLQRGVELLAPGGELVYTSTSMNPIENEAVVAAILRMSGGAVQLVDLHSRLPGFTARPGLSKWKVMTETGTFYDNVMQAPDTFMKDHDDSIFAPVPEEAQMFGLDKCLRVYPHDNSTSGFFCAMLTKTGKLPWVSQVADSESVPEEKVEEETTPPKPTYLKPFKYIFDVKVTEIEWTTEKTDDSLETTVTSDVTSFEQPTPKLMKQCVKLPRLSDVKRNNFLKADDEAWKSIKNFYGMTNGIDPTCIFLRGSANSYHLYLHSPIIKELYLANKVVHSDQRLKNSGLKVFRLFRDEESPDCDLVIADQGINALLPHMKKRIVKIDREQLDQLLTNRYLQIADLKDNFKAILPKETGCTVFHYVPPKGKAADPKCEIFLVGWTGKNIVKASTDTNVDIVHYLRLCGIDNPHKKRKELAKSPQAGVEVKMEYEEEEEEENNDDSDNEDVGDEILDD